MHPGLVLQEQVKYTKPNPLEINKDRKLGVSYGALAERPAHEAPAGAHDSWTISSLNLSRLFLSMTRSSRDLLSGLAFISSWSNSASARFSSALWFSLLSRTAAWEGARYRVPESSESDLLLIFLLDPPSLVFLDVLFLHLLVELL